MFSHLLGFRRVHVVWSLFHGMSLLARAAWGAGACLQSARVLQELTVHDGDLLKAGKSTG